MKNPKVLYILIGVLCFLAIVAGIYEHFFVKEQDRNNVIMPSLNQTGNDDIVEKTQEEIKTQFTKLFNNVINKGEYDTSSIKKTNQEKDIVYSAYDIIEKKENYEVNVHIPVVNIVGDVPANFNSSTQSIFANKASEILNNKNTNYTIYQMNYTGYINENILSLVIEATLKEGSNPQRVIVQTYNYNLLTGEKVEIADLLTQKNLVQSEVQKRINTTIEKSKKEAEILVQSGYTVYNRDLSHEMYKIANLSNYFLGQNGKLYILFAYGNQNYTSEMDIVLYE